MKFLSCHARTDGTCEEDAQICVSRSQSIIRAPSVVFRSRGQAVVVAPSSFPSFPTAATSPAQPHPACHPPKNSRRPTRASSTSRSCPLHHSALHGYVSKRPGFTTVMQTTTIAFSTFCHHHHSPLPRHRASASIHRE